MRKIDLIILHCSASNNPKHDDISVMRKWHQRRGWRDVGYHYFIKAEDGAIQKGRDEKEIGAHCRGKNTNSIGICLHGLLASDFTEAQLNSAAVLIMDIFDRYPDRIIDVVPHRIFSETKSCPVFNMIEIFKRLDHAHSIS